MHTYQLNILKRIERYLDKLIPLAILVTWLSSVVVLMSPIHNQFALVNLIAGCILLPVYVFRHRLKIEIKLFIVIIIPIAIGTYAFTDGGFSSAIISLFLLSNAVAIFFLDRIKSYIVTGLTLFIFLGLWIWSLFNDFQLDTSQPGPIWIIQALTLFLAICLLYFIAHAMQSYLYETIQRLNRSHEEAFNMAYFDQLTQLSNHNLFRIEMENQISQEHLNGFFVIFSVKNLNMINAIYGSDYGNALLKEAGRCLTSAHIKGERIARSGGNEFLLFIPQTHQADLVKRLLEIKADFFKVFTMEEMRNKLEYYVCYAPYDSNVHTLSESYDNATLALTYAKFKQTNTIQAYNQAFEVQLKRFAYLRDAIKEALDTDVITYHYQPKVTSKDGNIVGVEALVRWHTEAYGWIRPDELLSLVTALNLDIQFGRYTLRQVFSQTHNLMAKYGPNLHVAINISPSYLIAPNFVEDIKTYLLASELEPYQLVLEITEHALIEGVDKINTRLESLLALGIQIALDDFGSGYASLHYLAILDVQELKLDKALMDQIGTNPKINRLLTSIIQLAHAYGMRVVAEGIETAVQRDTLQEMDCELLQGYYFYRPEPLILNP